MEEEEEEDDDDDEYETAGCGRRIVEHFALLWCSTT
jgi:hypothetical protein